MKLKLTKAGALALALTSLPAYATTNTFTVDSSGSLSLTGDLTLSATTAANLNGILQQGSNTLLYEFAYGNNGTVTVRGWNIFIGANAGNFTVGSTATSALQGSENLGIGDYSLNSVTLGNYNVAIGTHSQEFNTIGGSNVSVGVDSMINSSGMTGSANVCMGTDACEMLLSGFNNTGIGDHALQSATTAYYNASLGAGSLNNNVSGNYNTALGMYSLFSMTGSNSVGVGYAAGYNDTNSNQFYVGDIQQSSLANDQAYSLLWGTFSGTAASLAGQQLTVNGLTTINGAPQTGSSASSFLRITGTWNTSGNPTAINLNVTDTADGGSPLLMNLQVGGVSKFNLDKNGVISNAKGVIGNSNAFYIYNTSSSFPVMNLAAGALINGSSQAIRWNSSTYLTTGSSDTSICRASAGVVGFDGGSCSSFTGGLIAGTQTLTAATPTVSPGQIGFGTTTVAAGTGTCPSGAAGCLVINVGGSTQNIPYY
jgi:hypothetical protein